jgi:hypothetical protein
MYAEHQDGLFDQAIAMATKTAATACETNDTPADALETHRGTFEEIFGREITQHAFEYVLEYVIDQATL